MNRARHPIKVGFYSNRMSPSFQSLYIMLISVLWLVHISFVFSLDKVFSFDVVLANDCTEHYSH